jgi:outer membrane protein OmpA-like peptidoglycan-associated protein
LSNVTFRWIGGLGNVAHPQRLPSTIAVQLEDFWRAILRESGAMFNEQDIRVGANRGIPIVWSEDEDSVPFVTTILFGTTGIELPPLPPIPDPIESDGDDVEPLEPPPSLEILSDQVAFIPDQAVFMNETAARDALRAYASWLALYFETYSDSQHVYVVGFHARVNLNGGNRLNTGLSARRAEAVRSVLIEYGVPEGRLIAVGLGINGGDHFRVDEFPNGVFCTTTAQQNRKTMLIPDLSEDAPKLLEVMAELDALRN